MAKKPKKQSGADIDWYLISIERLKQIGLVVLLLILGGAGWWFWHNQRGNPKSSAEAAIADARQALNTLAASTEFNAHRNEFARAQQKLDEANTLFGSSKFPEAQSAAAASQNISRGALAVGLDLESDAQFLTVEGDVKFQKGATSGDWKDAEPRTPLVNGDWVKTGQRASAELVFATGSLYTIGPNALLEIYSVVNPATSKKTNAVQMRVGSVEVATSGDTSTVRTPGTQVVVESESMTQVGVADERTSVVNTRGATAVAPKTGGPGVRLAPGEKVSATAAGELSPVKKLALPPALLSPGDNQVFQLSPELKVQFIWQQETEAKAYVLQVSRSRLFSTQEINERRAKTTATAKVTSEGAFYWRVASVGPDGDVGPFSTFRRFRVSGGGKAVTDREPPKLTMKQPFHVGGQFYTIAGSTEPGATVFFNDEEVDVESSGSFQKLVGFDKIGRNTIVIKAVDAAGNQTVQSQVVLVEE
jgi:glucodextranase-like protein/FecR-like protein